MHFERNLIASSFIRTQRLCLITKDGELRQQLDTGTEPRPVLLFLMVDGEVLHLNGAQDILVLVSRRMVRKFARLCLYLQIMQKS